MAFAITLVLIAVGSVLFHFLSPWHATPVASNWGGIDDTIVITLVITGIAFVAINLFIAYALVRYRHREGRRAHYEPHNRKLEWWLTASTTVGIVAMLAPGLAVYSDMIHAPKDASVLEVVAQQWQWGFRFPGKDGKLGVSDVRFISPENPMGLNPNDPNGQDDVLIQRPEVHLPVNKPVKVFLRSKDVVHDFYVPQFRVKLDMVPGMIPTFWFTPTKVGRFEILCSEYCGVGHFNMRGHVVVEDEAAFLAWLKAQPTYVQSVTEGGNKTAGGLSNRGKELAQAKGCAACHSVDGSRMVGPTWKDLYGKTETLADGSKVAVDEAYLKESMLQPAAKIVQGYPAVMPPISLNEGEVEALIAYIKASSSKGEVDSGQK